MDWKTVNLSVLAAAFSTVGGIFGSLLKDLCFPLFLEQQKSKRALAAVFKKFRDPILLSSIELFVRLDEIVRRKYYHCLAAKILSIQDVKAKISAVDEEYFQQYKLVSTLYRLCAFLGWLELYRQEITFLDSGSDENSKELASRLHRIRCDLSEGDLNADPDSDNWRDGFIFREEQRAIGEQMIETVNGIRTVIGYAKFWEQFKNREKDGERRWLNVALSFLLDLNVTDEAMDFRKVRCLLLLRDLLKVVELLDNNLIEKRFHGAATEIEGELSQHQIFEK